MPLAYPATNDDSGNVAAFGKRIGKHIRDKLEIVTHPNGSLFIGNDIKRPVQTG